MTAYHDRFDSAKMADSEEGFQYVLVCIFRQKHYF